jgi:hypothetical protein
MWSCPYLLVLCLVVLALGLFVLHAILCLGMFSSWLVSPLSLAM